MPKYVKYADSYPYVNKTKSLEDEINKLTAENLILRDMYLEIWDELIKTNVQCSIIKASELNDYNMKNLSYKDIAKNCDPFSLKEDYAVGSELYEQVLTERDDLRAENEKLRDTNRKINDYCNELEDENMVLKDKIDILSNQLEAKNKEVEELSKEHDKYESRIDELGELLRAYNKK